MKVTVNMYNVVSCPPNKGGIIEQELKNGIDLEVDASLRWNNGFGDRCRLFENGTGIYIANVGGESAAYTVTWIEG